MKRSISSWAAGKVIVCGEYAVLEGHQALVLAADRGLKVELQAADSAGINIKCPGFTQQLYQIQSWPWQPPAELGVFASLVVELIAQHFAEPELFVQQGWHLTTDSQAMFDAGAKLGLGSSAALCVALDSAFGQCRDSRIKSETLAARWQRLQQLHSLAQGKKGSGVDLAASLYGGALLFNNDFKEPLPAFKPARLAADVQLDFIWSGQSASTPAMLGSLSQWRQLNSQRCAAFFEALGRASAEVCANTGEALAFIASLRKFCKQLWDFDQAAELGIFSGGHLEPYKQSLNYQALIYKPCGAGGGDLGLLVSSSARERQAMLDFIYSRGLSSLNLKSMAST
ncbi:mevalonate kinase family protein [Agaribacterium haliotis]|uniref:mevalonate kinase family protein n=1 Tax=Agaribacterium haliotis TaxID=2013869 RepID=UPI000BB568DA|nr:ATP-binding protein [Agaribacterium haliotis]